MSNCNLGDLVTANLTMPRRSVNLGSLFVDDWSIEDTLGEGGFGEVKLLVNRHNGQAVAMKVTDLQQLPQHRRKLIRKEICIHRLLKSPNIIRFYGDRTEEDFVYMFLEYAPGGALYDHIDMLGMGCLKTQKYFNDLLAGLDYMHSHGVVHRDIKPENLLLDGNNTLKICDFGLATKFRHLGMERVLDTRCGTLQYIAPEVISGKYLGAPADIWSCGIVFVAMLTGDVPWAEATDNCPEYLNWINHTNPIAWPWSVIDTMALSLVRNLLAPVPKVRYNIQEILNHRWMLQTFEPDVLLLGTSSAATAYLMAPPPSSTETLDSIFLGPDSEEDARTCASQPLPHIAEETLSYTGAKFSFSQPTDLEALVLSSQPCEVPQGTKFQSLVRRMTRFFVKVSCKDALEALRNYLEKNGYRLKRNDAMLTISTKDRLQNPLVFKATALTMGNRTLLDFRLSKGCGLAFKHNFTAIKASLIKIVVEGHHDQYL